jgi:hypothetical protein
MDHLHHLLLAFALGMPPGILFGFLIGYPAGKARLLERYFGIEVGWGPKSAN